MLDTQWRFVAQQFVLAQQEGEAPAQQAQEQAPQNPFGGTLFIIVGMVAIFYFFIIRPQQKRERDRRQMLDSLSKGNRVVTNGGICGTIVGLSDNRVVLRVSDESNTKMEFLRSAIAQVFPKEEEKGSKNQADDEE